MKTIPHTTSGLLVVLLILSLALMAQAQNLPADSLQISPSQAAALDVGRLYQLSSWQPGAPPLPPAVLFEIIASGDESSDSATNCAIYFSASAQAVFVDDRALVAEQMLTEAAMTGNRPMSQDEEQGDNDLPTLDTTGLYLEITNVAGRLA